MEYLAQFNKVKGAVDEADLTQMKTVFVENGQIIASDSRLTAAAAWPDKLEYCVPASEFEKALKVLGDGIMIERKEDSIVVKRSRRRVTISCLDPKSVTHLGEVDGVKYDLDERFMKAITLLRDFMSDDVTRAWACSIRLSKGKAYATNNVAVAVTSTGVDESVDVTLPDWLINYLRTRRDGDPQSIVVTDNAIMFTFGDGSWVRSQRIAKEMYDQVLEVADSVGTASFEISRSWKNDFNDLLELSGETVVVGPNGLSAGKGQSKIEFEVETKLSVETYWRPKYLKPVVAVAKYIDFGHYPEPCPWSGEDIKGVIIGVSYK